MAIKTSTFGGVTLTGDAAKAFKKQFIDIDTPPNPQVQKMLNQGRKKLKEYQKKGCITVVPRKVR